MNLEPVALAAEALAKAIRAASVEIEREPSIPIPDFPHGVCRHCGNWFAGKPRCKESPNSRYEAESPIHTCCEPDCNFTKTGICRAAQIVRNTEFDSDSEILPRHGPPPTTAPTFISSPPPADLHPMCDAELDRLMDRLESVSFSVAQSGDGIMRPSAAAEEAKKAIRAFVRRKFDEEIKAAHIERDSAQDFATKLGTDLRGDIAATVRQRDAAREVVRDFLGQIAAGRGEFGPAFIAVSRRRAGLDGEPTKWQPIPPDPEPPTMEIDNGAIVVRAGEGIGVTVYGAGGGSSIPLTGHATGCTADKCVPSCPQVRR